MFLSQWFDLGSFRVLEPAIIDSGLLICDGEVCFPVLLTNNIVLLLISQRFPHKTS